jgi:hypothetical protein
LGIVRFARAGWDSRLGPADGALTDAGGVTFAPEFFEKNKWLRMADLSARYEGVWSAALVHPLLVRCAVEYRPQKGQTGPSFRDELIVTPDGILSTVTKTSPDAFNWAVTWPLLENDGAQLVLAAADRLRMVSYPNGSDQQSFIAIEPAQFTQEPLLRATYGDLRPVRVRSSGASRRTFVYPRSTGDPPAEVVRDSLVITADGFRSVLGRVSGTTYVGRSAAGGVGTAIDFDGDGVPDARFATECGFLIRLKGSKAVEVEVDRNVEATIQGKQIRLTSYRPAALP